MCELLAAGFEVERPFAELAPIVAGLERFGQAGFGWGVAWLDAGSGAVRGRRGIGRYVEEASGDESLLSTRSQRFLVHLRRPSKLSTVQMPDTQPFFDGEHSAWCHNGFLDRAEEIREQLSARLAGRADSEIGWRYFLDRLAEGTSPPEALRSVDETFGGKVNLGYLGADGELAVYSRNESNRIWSFRLGDGVMASTDLHSDDSSLFDLVVPAATHRSKLETGEAVRIAGPVEVFAR